MPKAPYPSILCCIVLASIGLSACQSGGRSQNIPNCEQLYVPPEQRETNGPIHQAYPNLRYFSLEDIERIEQAGHCRW